MKTAELTPVHDRLNEIEGTGHNGKIFALFAAGTGSSIVAVGKSYESMWQHAQELLEQPKEDLRKQNYVFDHLTIRNAKRILNGEEPVYETAVKPAAVKREIGNSGLTTTKLQKQAERARREAEAAVEEDEE